MLQPLLVNSLGNTGLFKAVVLAPTAVTTDICLEAELQRLRQIFSESGNSRIQLSLRLQIIIGSAVVATKLFEKTIGAESPDAQGGAAAVNNALEEILPEIAKFCAALLQLH